MSRRRNAGRGEDVLGAVGNAVHRPAVIACHDLAFGLPRLLQGLVGRGEKIGIDLGIEQRRPVEQRLRQLDRRYGLALHEVGGFRNR